MQWQQRDGPFQMTSLGFLLLAYTEVPLFQIYPKNLRHELVFAFKEWYPLNKELMKGNRYQCMFKWIHEYHRQWKHEWQKGEGEGGATVFFFGKDRHDVSIENLAF